MHSKMIPAELLIAHKVLLTRTDPALRWQIDVEGEPIVRGKVRLNGSEGSSFSAKRLEESMVQALSTAKAPPLSRLQIKVKNGLRWSSSKKRIVEENAAPVSKEIISALELSIIEQSTQVA